MIWMQMNIVCKMNIEYSEKEKPGGIYGGRGDLNVMHSCRKLSLFYYNFLRKILKHPLNFDAHTKKTSKYLFPKIRG